MRGRHRGLTSGSKKKHKGRERKLKKRKKRKETLCFCERTSDIWLEKAFFPRVWNCSTLSKGFLEQLSGASPPSDILNAIDPRSITHYVSCTRRNKLSKDKYWPISPPQNIHVNIGVLIILFFVFFLSNNAFFLRSSDLSRCYCNFTLRQRGQG